MPELPEVESIRRQLAPRLPGRTVVEAWSHPSPRFSEATEVEGGRLGAVRRRGKYLLVDVDGGRELVLHLGMTGSLRFDRSTDDHTRARWALDDGHSLVLSDIRRFGRVSVVPAGEYGGLPTLAALGPEPLSDDFTAEGLHAAVRRSRSRVKTQLLSQRPVAGIGNIYADEALWSAGIHPSARSLSRARAELLHESIRSVLAAGIRHGGTTLRDYVDVAGGTGGHQHHLRCYGRSGSPCPRCGATLRRSVVDGRATTWCPVCQRR